MSEQGQAAHNSNGATDNQNLVKKPSSRTVLDRYGFRRCGRLRNSLILVATFLPYLTERVKFATEFGLGLAVLFAVIAQVLINHQQWKIMEQQTAAMKRQENITGETLVIGYKSYVGVHSVELQKSDQTIFVRIENVGHVPASNIFVSMSLIASRDLDAIGVTHGAGGTTTYPVTHKAYGSTQLFAGDLQIMECIYLRRHLFDDDLDLIESGNGTLFLEGFITYSDGFKNQPIQRTDFFFKYHAAENFWGAESPELWKILIDLRARIEEDERKNPN